VPGAASPPWESALAIPGVWDRTTRLDVEQYRVPSPAVPVLKSTRDYARRHFKDQRPWLDAMLELTQRIRTEFKYDTKSTTVSTSVEEVLEMRSGVCQDFAHLMLSCLRSLGLPARYVSGYVLNRRKDGKDSNAGADASHAWVASHCPAHGWVAFDPTNGKIADTEFVTLGWGREYHDVSPLRGVVRGAADQKLAVAVSVVPVEDPANA
jgi:transglutaminase-like putative cysteine protease